MTDDGGDIPPLTDGWFERLEQDLEKDEVLYFPGQQIGGFRLIEPLGSGGLGMVWKANRIQPPQTVAIKFIKPGLMTPFNRHLFMREQTTLARMNHPGIAVAIDPEGMTERQRPYLVMEFVDGRPITDYCDREGLGIPERLELFIQVCEALQHAHNKSVVHRDIKPSNVLAFSDDQGLPQVKVIDFGIAKIIDPDGGGSSGLTEQFRERDKPRGTRAYMSPEQIEGRGDSDPRSDVYALGVLLYELLAGATPREKAELDRLSDAEFRAWILEEDPVTPSSRLSGRFAKRPEAANRFRETHAVELRAAVRLLRRELDWIPLKAMRKDPEVRYQSARELALDIRRYLDGKPISAAPPSRLYRMRKFARRERYAIGTCLVAGLVLALGVSVMLWRSDRRVKSALDERNRTLASEYQKLDAQNQELEERRKKLADDLESKTREVRTAELERQAAKLESQKRLLEAEESVRRLDEARTEAEALEARNFAFQIQYSALQLEKRGLREFRRTLADALQLTTPEGAPRAGWEWRWLFGQGDQCLQPVRAHRDTVSTIAFSPDTRALLTGSFDATGRVIDVARGEATGHTLSHQSGLTAVAFTPDGTRAVTAGRDRRVLVWETSGWSLLHRFTLARAHALLIAASPDQRFVALGLTDGAVVVIDSVRGDIVTVSADASGPAAGGTTALAFSADGRWLAAGSARGRVRVIDVRDLGPAREFEGLAAPVGALAFTEDGARLVAATLGAKASIWRVDDGEQLHDWGLPSDSPNCTTCAVHPTGRSIAFGYRTGEIELVDLWSDGSSIAATGVMILPDDGQAWEVSLLRYSANGEILAAGRGSDLVIYDLVTGGERGRRVGHSGPIVALACSADGSRIATGGYDGVVRLWDSAPDSSRLRVELATGAKAEAEAFSPDGRRLAIATSTPGVNGTTGANGGKGARAVHIFDARSGRSLATAPAAFSDPHRGPITSVCFDAAGERVLTASQDGSARLIGLSDGLVRTFGSSAVALREAVCSPDGRRIATLDDQGRVEYFDAATGVSLGCRLATGDRTVGIRFLPDGVLASATEAGEIWMMACDGRSEPTRDRAIADAGAGAVRAFDASRDGRRLLLLRESGAVQVCERAAPDSAVRTLTKREDEEIPQSARFDSAGTRIVVCDALQRARIWDIDSGLTLIEFPSSLRGRRTAIDPTGQRIVIADRDATIVDCVPRHVRFAEEQAERLGRPLDTGADFSADLGADFVRETEFHLPSTWFTDRERTERKPAFLP